MANAEGDRMGWKEDELGRPLIDRRDRSAPKVSGVSANRIP